MTSHHLPVYIVTVPSSGGPDCRSVDLSGMARWSGHDCIFDASGAFDYENREGPTDPGA